MLKKILQIIGKLCFMIIIPLVSTIHIFILNNYRPGTREYKIFIDDWIPFVKYFAVPYQFMVLFITIVLIYFAIVDYRYYFKLLATVLIATGICYIIFYFFPSTVNRPVDSNGNLIRVGGDFFLDMVQNIRDNDKPYDCFPSIHVISCYLPMLFVLKHNKSMLMNIFAFISGVSITLSTMFLKQHYFMDAFVSIIMGTILFLIFTNDSLWNMVPLKSKMGYLVPTVLRGDITDTSDKNIE
jgi:membrane-associated phospholipid phosphatase